MYLAARCRVNQLAVVCISERPTNLMREQCAGLGSVPNQIIIVAQL